MAFLKRRIALGEGLIVGVFAILAPPLPGINHGVTVVLRLVPPGGHHSKGGAVALNPKP